MKLILFFLLVCVGTCAAQTDPALREELLKMRAADQTAREACANGLADEQMKCLVETLEKIDKPNTARLNEIFNRYGFPSAEAVGKDGVEAFLLILQHTPDEALRRKCLKPIRKAFMRREIPAQTFANYVDRLLAHQGRPQIYGSNFDIKDGKLVMGAVKDRKNLNRRRQKIGLPPIEEYARMLKEFYNLEVSF